MLIRPDRLMVARVSVGSNPSLCTVKIHLPARSPMNPNRPESLVVVSAVRSAWSLGAVCANTVALLIGSPSAPRTIPEMMADCAPAVAGASQARPDTSSSAVRRGDIVSRGGAHSII